MADPLTRLVVDCSVIVKWKIATEDHAAEAAELFLDWEHQVIVSGMKNRVETVALKIRTTKGWMRMPPDRPAPLW